MLPVLRNTMTRTTPWMTPVNRLERLFDRFFEDSFFNYGFTPEWGTGVPVSLWQDEDHVYIEAELPGLSEGDIELTLRDGSLVIRGEKKGAIEDKARRVSERFYGRFERAIPLPGDVREDQVNATFKNGVLTVTLPKSAEAAQKSKRIPIKTQ